MYIPFEIFLCLSTSSSRLPLKKVMKQLLVFEMSVIKSIELPVIDFICQ